MNDFCPQAVIFDMDGLLVDSEPVWAIAEDAMMTARSRQIDPAIQNGLVGLRMSDFLAGMREAYGMSDSIEDLRADINGRMIRLIPDRVIPRLGAPELLAALERWGIPCAIASSSGMAIIDTVVKSQGWQRCFRTHVTGDDVPHGKPAPDIYLEAARQLGVDPAACLALEDSPTGARAAVAAGMVCYAVPDLSHTSVEKFASVTPHVYATLHDVLAALNGCY
ncbi:MAG: HAD family phosphatase [Chloroflexota bacterium]